MTTKLDLDQILRVCYDDTTESLNVAYLIEQVAGTTITRLDPQQVLRNAYDDTLNRVKVVGVQ